MTPKKENRNQTADSTFEIDSQHGMCQKLQFLECPLEAGFKQVCPHWPPCWIVQLYCRKNMFTTWNKKLFWFVELISTVMTTMTRVYFYISLPFKFNEGLMLYITRAGQLCGLRHRVVHGPPHPLVHFWNSWGLEGIRFCQDVAKWNHNTELQNRSSENLWVASQRVCPSLNTVCIRNLTRWHRNNSRVHNIHITTVSSLTESSISEVDSACISRIPLL